MEQGLYNSITGTTPGDDTEHIVQVDKIQANLFFDGTRNNYYNVEKADAATRAKYGGEDTSYDNALSNVARMWTVIGTEKENSDMGVYIEGMGTTKFEDDAMAGYALGTGETGIKTRAQSAFQPLIDEVKKNRGDLGPPAILELNLYGFSRGAATARHFAHLLRDQHEIARHFTDKWSQVQVVVNFVGLFDTVSSEGIVYGNDVNDLGLRFSAGSARRVFHLIALDEYRLCFSDTTIDSALKAKVSINNLSVPMGFELGMPGSHSDVGGGYVCDVNKNETEVRDLAPSEWDPDQGGAKGSQDFVYQQGWYRASDKKASTWHPHRHQRSIHGDYYKVALALMVDMAERSTVSRYSEQLNMIAQTPAIAEIQTALRQLVQEHAFKPGKPTRINWELNAQLGAERAKAFRHAYLHVSANDNKTGMWARYPTPITWGRHHEMG
jgi:hypothetical protein